MAHKHKKLLALVAFLVSSTSATLAAEVTTDFSSTEESRGFGSINHFSLGVNQVRLGFANLDLRLENKRQAKTATQAAISGNFLEGIFSYDVSPSVYAVTRIGFTDEKRLFVDKSIYQEFGYKAGQIFPGIFLDLNGGVGARSFFTGDEVFANFGPSFSTANATFVLRREQSLSSGGYRNVVAGSYVLAPKWKLDASLIDESRRRFTAPIGAVAAQNIDGTKVTAGVKYEFTLGSSVFFRAEKIKLKRAGLGTPYYDPTALAIGATIQF
jgi:hypothetical protein